MKIALTLAKKLRGGETIILNGNLGVGKTVFARGLGRGLNVRKTIKSPTFTYVKVYPTRKGGVRFFIHVDVYRLQKPSQSIRLGLRDVVGKRDCVVVIEWGRNIRPAISPRQFINVTMRSRRDDVRTILVSRR